MSKGIKEVGIEKQLIDLAVRIFQLAETSQKQNFMIRNSLFDIQYSLFPHRFRSAS